jgi:hypothetical protein
MTVLASCTLGNVNGFERPLFILQAELDLCFVAVTW